MTTSFSLRFHSILSLAACKPGELLPPYIYKLQQVTKCRSVVGATGGKLVEVVEGKVVVGSVSEGTDFGQKKIETKGLLVYGLNHKQYFLRLIIRFIGLLIYSSR